MPFLPVCFLNICQAFEFSGHSGIDVYVDCLLLREDVKRRQAIANGALAQFGHLTAYRCCFRRIMFPFLNSRFKLIIFEENVAFEIYGDIGHLST